MGSGLSPYIYSNGNMNPYWRPLSGITGRAYLFDGGVSTEKPYVNLGKPAITANVYDGGGSFVWSMNAKSDGGGNLASVINKAYIIVQTRTEAGGKVALRFYQFFSGDRGIWDTGVIFDVTKFYQFALIYDNSLTTNDPVIHYRCLTDGDTSWTTLTVGSGLTEDTTPTGTRISDAGSNLLLGNSLAGTRCFDGYIFDVRVYDSELTASDLKLLLTHSATITSPVQSISCQDTPVGEANIITGTDYDMTGANNWAQLLGLTTFDVNTTVANRAYALGDGTAPEGGVLTPFLVETVHRMDFLARLNAGASQEFDCMATDGSTFKSFGFTPTSTESPFDGLLNVNGFFLVIGDLTGMNAKAIEFRNVSAKPIYAEDTSGNSNDGLIVVQGSGFFAEGVQTWV